MSDEQDDVEFIDCEEDDDVKNDCMLRRNTDEFEEMVMQSVAADREVSNSVPNAQEMRFYIDRAMQMQQQQNMIN